MNEQQIRQFLYLKSKEIYNGISYISQLFIIAKNTLKKAMLEIETGDIYRSNAKIRKKGGGRKIIEKNVTFLHFINNLKIWKGVITYIYNNKNVFVSKLFGFC